MRKKTAYTKWNCEYCALICATCNSFNFAITNTHVLMHTHTCSHRVVVDDWKRPQMRTTFEQRIRMQKNMVENELNCCWRFFLFVFDNCSCIAYCIRRLHCTSAASVSLRIILSHLSLANIYVNGYIFAFLTYRSSSLCRCRCHRHRSLHLLITVLFFFGEAGNFLSPGYLERVRSIINVLGISSNQRQSINALNCFLVAKWPTECHVEQQQLKSWIERQANKFLFLICMLLRPKMWFMWAKQPHMLTALNAVYCAPFRYFKWRSSVKKQWTILPTFFDSMENFTFFLSLCTSNTVSIWSMLSFFNWFDFVFRSNFQTKNEIDHIKMEAICVERESERETQAPATKVAFNRFLQVALRFDRKAAAKSLSFMHFSDLIYNNISAPVTGCRIEMRAKWASERASDVNVCVIIFRFDRKVHGKSEPADKIPQCKKRFQANCFLCVLNE